MSRISGFLLQATEIHELGIVDSIEMAWCGMALAQTYLHDLGHLYGVLLWTKLLILLKLAMVSSIKI